MLQRNELLRWLRETDDARLEELWAMADSARREGVGDAVHLRGLIEISNYCGRRCGYCGLRSENRGIERYRMSGDEILGCAKEAERLGYGTVVMQAGEDFGIEKEWMADIIREIKRTTPLAVTLSLGERDEDEFLAWKEAGANRYLLRFETSDPELYALIHPPKTDRPLRSRPEILRGLREIGYEIGSGVMAGIPGQTYETLASDLELFRLLDLDMIGIGPYLPHPETPMGCGEWLRDVPPEEQTPNSELMTYKMVALTRLMCPEANIPSTTALATINKAQGRELGLMRGANVVMPNVTPPEYRVKYEIYPDKACLNETAAQCHGCLAARIRSIGRTVGLGPGGRRHRVEVKT
ncbi:MAG: [FeFe] hydrogenase H-cluster radical SAM maturase HydE [FCB group bacterium]|jgi:biotin synthase|nr:[FeFe] hydrogenase H-cluster radical SAM maturase HydE [FCB group bacterium]